MRHKRAAAGLWAAAAIVAGCVDAPADGSARDRRDGAPEAAGATATVTRQDLTTRDEVAGSLGYGDVAPLVAGRDGMVTWMPEEGTVVRRGEVIAELDGVATRLLLGERPAWRRLAVGEHDGPDVRQLNDNLAALGYAERDALPDQRFDWRTRRAVRRWQRDLGLLRTGSVELGDVAFLPSEIRIGTVETAPGTRVGGGHTLANATGTEQVVTVDLDAARRGSLSVEAPVVVALPDETRIDGAVRSIGRVVSAPTGPDDRPTVKVEIELVGVAAGSDVSGDGSSTVATDLEAAPVVVTLERVLAEDALTVPVGALVARTGGGYAVERVTADDTEFVAVEPGQFADGLVEITGDIADGDSVVVPS